MRKTAIALILVCLLIAAAAADVLAETQVSFNGYYRVRGWYKNNLSLSDQSADEDKSSYFDHRFQFGAKFKVSDALTMNIRARSDNNGKWGVAVGDRDTDSVYLDRAYMDILTPYGLFSVGRQTGGQAGLYVFGYGGSPVGLDRYVFDNEDAKDRIKLTVVAGSVGFLAVYEKDVERDATADNVAGEAEMDRDNFFFLPFYKFEHGAVNCLFAYVRDRANLLAPNSTLDMWQFNPALQWGVGSFQANLEAKWATGTLQSQWLPRDIDLEGFGFYVDGAYQYGSGELGAFYAYFQGDDDLLDSTVKGLVRSGADFLPLLVAYEVGLPTPAPFAAVGLNMTMTNAANHSIFGLWWDHHLTEDLLVHAGYGYINLNEVPTGVDDHYGSEIDVGLVYRIMDGLDYTAVLGYFLPGDAWKGGVAGVDLGNAYAFKHQLVLRF